MGQTRTNPTNFHALAKPVGPLCNMACTYCFYLEKERLYQGTTTWAMPEDVLESFIRQYIEAQDQPAVTFAWQGGEPTLLGVAFFRKIVELQAKYAGGKRIANTFQTNGILLDDDWGAFLAENSFLVGVSMDGPRELHDRYRTDRGGQPTFDRVLRGLEYLKKHGVEFNTLTVVQRDNSQYPMEVYRFLKDVGSRFMQFIPIVERVAIRPVADNLSLVTPRTEVEAQVTEWSVEPELFGGFLCAIFDEWVQNDVGRYFVQLFDNALACWAGAQPGLCIFQEVCGFALAIEHNGDVYSCDHFVFPEHRLGNIMQSNLAALVRSPQQKQFSLAKRERLPRYCRECEFLFACRGECPKNRFVTTPNGDPGLNYLCSGYRMFFHHVDPYMKFMAGELAANHAPANVMRWAREKKSQERRGC